MELTLNSISVSQMIGDDFSEIRRKIFPIRTFFEKIIWRAFTRKKEKTVQPMIAVFDKICVGIIGCLQVVDSYDQAAAGRELVKVRALIAEYGEISQLLEKAEYFYSDEIKQKSSACLSGLFRLEQALKKNAFKGKAIAADLELKKAMAFRSKSIANNLN